MDALLEWSWLIIAFPLLGLLINLISTGYTRERMAGIVASMAAAASFGMALMVFAALLSRPPEARLVEVTLYQWAIVPPLTAEVGLRIDPLSIAMALIVTLVGTLIHVYSIGYMAGDPHIRRFFMFLNLFLASMLLLVLADNFLILFVGWELVGLCSYLLIGFWFETPYNAWAGRKAFIVNRIGDFGFTLGLLLLFWTFGTFRYGPIFEAAEHGAVEAGVATLITLLLFAGVTGKSAQIPLYVWLPDAMAGPTPVSALIHAATMVTAGVYLIARAHPLFELAPLTQGVITLVGAATALWAALIAIGQFDLKRVLAFSTISQLGYMVAAAGAGAVGAAIFHLGTHAFFKALLFLGAGSVIHALEHAHRHHPDASPFDPNDMRRMGGLARRMPTTFWTFGIGAAALAGLPPLAGFWSKDEILAALGKAGGWTALAYGLLVAAAFLTAFYMTRQVAMIFAGAPRSAAAGHAHESPAVMTVPLMIFAFFSVGVGWINAPGLGALSAWLELGYPPVFHPEQALLATLVALAGIGTAWAIYRPQAWPEGVEDPLRPALRGFFTALTRKLYVDELYDVLFVRPFERAARAVADVVEPYGIDGAVHAVARLVGSLASGVRRWSSGYVRQYGLSVLIGAVLLVFYILWMLR
ncbi:NADH-quinone oxidoreductase subunit L [Thermoflexus sp.]|uniref:NADH-quinone oxidoreductase subunit L n=1 Tax=Thermoflexus sp. TaxID=1969742 RepID=UPI002ADE6597|nr:NADH-quinone oxidoreductase subunit L [Thermoflexus sp.]